MRRLAATALLSILISSGANAATYFVSPSGNNGNPGTVGSPWRTISHAAGEVTPGDTVLIGTGVYREQVILSVSGSAGSPITFAEAPGGTAVIDGTGIDFDRGEALVQIDDLRHLSLTGIEIRDSEYEGVSIKGESHHVHLSGLYAHDNGGSGAFLEGPNRVAAHSSVRDSRFEDNSRGGITLWQSGGGYFLIEGNIVSGNDGTSNYDGIQVGGGDGATHHVVVRNNTISNNGNTDSGEDNLDLGGHGINHHYLVEQNNISGSIGSFKLHSGSAADATYTPGVSSFHIARFNRLTGHGITTYGYPNPIALYNNTLYDCHECVLIYGQSANLQSLGDSTYSGGDAGRFNSKNNLIFQNASSSHYAVLTAGLGTFDLTYDSVRLRNNLYKLAVGQRIAWTRTYGPPLDASAFAHYKASNSPDLPDAGSILSTASVSVMFASAAPNSYCLAPGSPANGSAATLTTAVGSGSLTARLVVDRASYFVDGYCEGGECVGEPDSIVIGGGSPVAISSIDDATNTITLAAARSWSIGAAVTLQALHENPDIGGGACVDPPVILGGHASGFVSLNP